MAAAHPAVDRNKKISSSAGATTPGRYSQQPVSPSAVVHRSRRIDSSICSQASLKLVPPDAPSSNCSRQVVLAYSGGLDTSIILKWLQDEYDCEVCAATNALIV